MHHRQTGQHPIPQSRHRHSVRAVGATLALALTATLPSAQPAAAANVVAESAVTNYSFEAGTTGWTGVSSTGASCALTTSTRWASHGKQSLVLTPSTPCPSPTAVSDPTDLAAGATSVRVVASVQSRGRSGLGLRFLDDTGKITGTVAPELSAPPPGRGWEAGRVVERQASVPAGSTRVQVVVAAVSEAKVDEVLMTAPITELGSQITKPAAYLASEVGVDADGRAVIFSVATGAGITAAKLVVTDALTMAVRHTFPLEGATGSWTLRQDPTTKTLYIGTYGAPSLYAWNPGETSVRNLGRLPIDMAGMVYSIDFARDGRIYGGTWGEPAAGYPGAQMWTYSPTEGFAKFGPVLTTDAFYSRAVAYEDMTGTVWAGTATKGHLYGCTEDGKCTDFTSLLGPKTLAHVGVYNVEAMDGYVMAWGGASTSLGDDEITILKVEVVNGEIQARQVGVIDSTVYYGPSDVHDGKIYYLHTSEGWPMYSYDLATGVETKLEGGPKMAARKWRIVELNDPAWPGFTIVGWSSNGTIYRRNLTTGAVDSGRATGQPPMPTELNSVTVGPDQRIWTAGYLTGGIGVSSPMVPGSVVSYATGGQAESMTSYRGRIYQGTYPYGRIDSFTPQEVAAGSAPRTDCMIGSNQNRPYGLMGHGDRVYFGSQADYGTSVGAFGWLDLTTGTCTTLSQEVGHYSVNRLAASGSKVYGGTNIYVAWDGLPVESEAKLLIFDESTQQLRLVSLPVRGIRSIDALTTAPDGKVWAYAGGWIFVIDPATDRVVHQELLFGDLVPTGRIAGNVADLLTGPSGILYGRAGSRVYAIDPVAALAGKSVAGATRILTNQGSKNMTIDRFGNLYTISRDQLIRIDPNQI